ncbi:uncharacterized protein LOC143116666 isoform X1 [Alosa pseudoharengus]|uniref:uncharacterized protein LOC143116666 isoform X1 n=1 Tax=Alosa pseudoharengus TaxID=34774 RepID=UPI003F8B1282
MAAPGAGQGDEQEKLEDEFQQTIRRIGGKEKIYLIGEVCKNDGNQSTSLQTLVDEMFSDSKHNPSSVNTTLNDNTRPENQTNTLNDVADIKDILPIQDKAGMDVSAMDGNEPGVNGDIHRTIRSSRNATAAARLIDSAMIIFIFKHEYISSNCNHICIKEIMKDVKARTKHSPNFPAVIGLVHSVDETRGSLQSVQVLERLLHSVYRKHSSDTVWAGLYIPNTVEKIISIKRHVSKAVHSSLSPDNVRTNNRLWSLKCLSRRRQRRQPRGSCISRSVETVEGIPLKSRGHQGDFSNGISSSES